MAGFTEWDRDRAPDLAGLVTATLPDDDLPTGTLSELCWGDPDPSVVLGADAGADGAPLAAGAAVVRRQGDHPIGFIRLLAVRPEARREGLGRSLLDELEEWTRGQRAVEVRLGGEEPHFLWPGVDVTATPALCLGEAAGYLDRGAALNLGCSTAGEVAVPPEGVNVVRVTAEDGPPSGGTDLAAVLDLVRAEWPWWEPEVTRGTARARCWAAATTNGEVIGVACHSVNRPGWFGPIGTRPAMGRRGVGTALLTTVLADLATHGHAHAEIAWIGPVGFYAKAVGATVSHVYRTLAKPA